MKIHAQEEIDTIVKLAVIYSISCYTTLLRSFPEMKSVANSNLLPFWDYMITITCIGVIEVLLTNNHSEEEEQEVINAFENSLKSLDNHSPNALRNCKEYVNKLVSSGVEIQDAVGGWVWINLEKNDKSNEELKIIASSLSLVRPTGTLIMGFHNWLKTK